MPLSCSIDLGPTYRINKKLIADSSGFKYKKEAGYCCTVSIYSGLFLNSNFTDGEILAVLIHEIGHNFQDVINKDCYYFSDINRVFVYLTSYLLSVMQLDIKGIMDTTSTILLSSNTIKLLDVKVKENIRKNDDLSSVFGMISILNGILLDLNCNLIYIITLFTKYGRLPIIMLSNIIGKIANPLGKTHENISDSFAATYGYGPELSSALLKMDKEPYTDTAKILYDTPIIGDLVAAYDLPFEILMAAFDEHPAVYDRMSVVRNNLLRDLESKDIDKNLKDKLKGDIRKLDDVFDDYNKLTKSGDIKTARLARFQSFNTQNNDKVSRKVQRDMDDIFRSKRLK